MAVTAVRVTPVAFPDPPLLNSAGVHEPWALRAIVEVRTGDGLLGLGETYGDTAHLARLDLAAAGIIGLDVFNLAALAQCVARALGVADAPRVLSPFEVAFLDLQGQAIERPVHALLGGKVRDRVPLSAYLFYKWAAHPGAAADPWGEALDPAGIVAQAGAMIERYGFGSIKLKGGVCAPDVEMDAVRALREAFPGHPLRLDPNCAWTVDTSIRAAQAMSGVLEYLEDPTPGIAGMARVAAEADMPLATNMCVVAFADVPPAFDQAAIGVVLADHHFWGGLCASARLAAICDTWRVGLSMHSNTHLGISLAAMTHLAAAIPNLTYAVDTHTPWQCGVDVVEAPLPITGGSVTVPDDPGLGVTLDRDALARMHEDYQRCGIRRRDDTAYMQRFQPDYRKLRPRW